MKILVRSPNWIGDQVLAYPFFHFLRKAYPSARITAVCAEWVESVQFRNLVDEVEVLPRPLQPNWKGRFRALEQGARSLRAKGPWDLGISLPNSLSSAWLLYRAGARGRRGYSTEGRGFLLDQRIAWEPQAPRHRSEAYVHLLPEQARPKSSAMEFWGIPAENDLDEGIPGELDAFDPLAAWPGHRGVEPPSTDYWVLAPGSTAESRRWPVERFAQLARLVQDRTGWTGVIVGGPAEAPLAEVLCESRKLKLLDRTAQGAVPGLWKVFRNAKFTIANDSGLAHVAALCGSPVHIAWGAGKPQRTKPIGPGRVSTSFHPVDCWPCERNKCTQPAERRLECIRGIDAEPLWKELQSAIRF